MVRRREMSFGGRANPRGGRSCAQGIRNLGGNGCGQRRWYSVPYLAISRMAKAISELAGRASRKRGEVETVRKPLDTGGLAHGQPARNLIVIREVCLRIGCPGEPVRVEATVGVEMAT